MTNPANYAVIELGDDEQPGGGDDIPVVIDSVVYSSASKTATLSVNGGQPTAGWHVPDAGFRVYVCRRSGWQ